MVYRTERALSICLIGLICIIWFFQTINLSKKHEGAVWELGIRQEKGDASIVFAVPTDTTRHILVTASRASRKGFRTVYATNASLPDADFIGSDQETWTFFPDDSPPVAKYPGDVRAALVPFLAFEVLGDTFEWLLYGDDDTQWFVANVRQMLNKLDASLPYILTDNLWWSDVNGTIGSHPHPRAPRCLPCHKEFQESASDQRMKFPAPYGCPCTPRLLCNAVKSNIFDKDCNVPLHLSPTFSSRTYSLHGGAGAIISIGLLRLVTTQQMKDCIQRHGPSTGGDAYVTICLWKLGHGHTDPGVFLDRQGVSAFGGVEHMTGGAMARLFLAASADQCVLDDFVCKGRKHVIHCAVPNVWKAH